MSFQSLISGSECSVAANPLSQVLKHTEGDRSLQQDRVAGPSSSRLHHLPGTSSMAMSEHDVALARQFFEASSHDPRAGLVLAGAPPLPLELPRISEASTRPMNEFTESWTMEHPSTLPVLQQANARSDWAAEFGNSVPTNMTAGPDILQRPSYLTSPSLYGNSMQMSLPMYGRNMVPTTYSNFQLDNGKGKGREADLEAAFAQVAASLPQTETARIVEIPADTTDIEEALKKASLESRDGAEEYGTDFKKVWDHLQNSDMPPPKEDLAKWEAEFNQLMSAQREELDHDYAGPMQQAWEHGMGDFSGDSAFGEPLLKFDEDGLPILAEYVFEKNNKYLESSNPSRSFLGDAKYLLDNNGSLSEAALLLEAAIQKGELGEGGYEAWVLLGETRSMDEREEAGMKALMEGVKRAEAAGASGAGMLSLAISFTNESFDRGSHAMLLRWIRARFPNHPVPEDTIKALSTNASWDAHNRITEVYLNLARSQHNEGVMDPDVQIGLGVLFYTNGEYDRAKDCFEAALSARPRDYLLWNRLGSSLSNGNKPEEALGAYREALQLRPTYTRAIYNVGVACLNIGAHKEAAEHFFTALTLQESNGEKTSEQLWSTLRRTFLSMERPDLADLAKPESSRNLDIFRREGFDF